MPLDREYIVTGAMIAGAVLLVAIPVGLAWASATGRLEGWWRRERQRGFREMSPRAKTLGEYFAAFLIAQLVVGLPLILVTSALELTPEDLLPDWLQVAIAIVLAWIHRS